MSEMEVSAGLLPCSLPEASCLRCRCRQGCSPPGREGGSALGLSPCCWWFAGHPGGSWAGRCITPSLPPSAHGFLPPSVSPSYKDTGRTGLGPRQRPQPNSWHLHRPYFSTRRVHRRWGRTSTSFGGSNSTHNIHISIEIQP